MFKITVVSDDPLYCIELDLMLTALNYRVQTIETSDIKVAIHSIDQGQSDIVLTDIFLNQRPSGLLLAKELAKRSIAYIFYTANDQPGIFEVAKRLRPYAYLVKPFDRLALDRAIKLALSHHRKGQGANRLHPFSAKNTKGDLVKSDFADVRVIETIGNYCYLHLGDDKLVTRTSMVKLINRLPENMFLRVHRRYLVAKRLVKKINTSKARVYVMDNAYPIGAKYQRELSALMDG